MSRYIALRPLAPDKAIEVLERDDNDVLIGSWWGYWNFNNGTVALYPNVTNHAVNWPGGVIPKGRRVVSDRIVERKANTEPKVQKGGRLAAARSQNGSDVINVIHDRSAATLHQEGGLSEGEAGGGVQQKIKFY